MSYSIQNLIEELQKIPEKDYIPSKIVDFDDIVDFGTKINNKNNNLKKEQHLTIDETSIEKEEFLDIDDNDENFVKFFL